MIKTRRFTRRGVYTLATIVTMLLVSACASDGDGVASNRECRTFETAGSKMRKSVCMTTEQWAVADAEEAANESSDTDPEEFFRGARERGAQNQTTSFDSPTPAL